MSNIRDEDKSTFATVSDNRFPMTFTEEVSRFVSETYRDADTILEYGSGGSTLLAAQLGKPIISVETDREWQASINDKIQLIEQRNQISSVVWVDIGKTKNWGFPVDFRKFKRFWKYPLVVWTEHSEFSPDVVLIDGRMRRACFVTVLAMTKKSVRILFDDYTKREHYHEVECLGKPTFLIGRMAVFDVEPGMVTMKDFPKFLPWFFSLW